MDCVINGVQETKSESGVCLLHSSNCVFGFEFAFI